MKKKPRKKPQHIEQNRFAISSIAAAKISSRNADCTETPLGNFNTKTEQQQRPTNQNKQQPEQHQTNTAGQHQTRTARTKLKQHSRELFKSLEGRTILIVD